MKFEMYPTYEKRQGKKKISLQEKLKWLSLVEVIKNQERCSSQEACKKLKLPTSTHSIWLKQAKNLNIQKNKQKKGLSLPQQILDELSIASISTNNSSQSQVVKYEYFLGYLQNSQEQENYKAQLQKKTDENILSQQQEGEMQNKLQEKQKKENQVQFTLDNESLQHEKIGPKETEEFFEESLFLDPRQEYEFSQNRGVLFQ